jgi:hypothetical protein
VYLISPTYRSADPASRLRSTCDVTGVLGIRPESGRASRFRTGAVISIGSATQGKNYAGHAAVGVYILYRFVIKTVHGLAVCDDKDRGGEYTGR